MDELLGIVLDSNHLLLNIIQTNHLQIIIFNRNQINQSIQIKLYIFYKVGKLVQNRIMIAIQNYVPTTKQQLQNIFRSYDSDNDGILSLTQFKTLLKDFQKSPQIYEVDQLFQSTANNNQITEQEFVVWFLAWNIKFAQAAFFRFDLKKWEKKLTFAGPNEINEQQKYNSTIKFGVEKQNTLMDKQFKGTFLLDKQTMKHRISLFQKMIKKQLNHPFLGITIKVKNHANLIKDKIQKTINSILDMVKQFFPQIQKLLELISIKVGHYDNYVGIIIESKYDLFSEMILGIQQLVNVINPNIKMGLEMLFKSQSLQQMFSEKNEMASCEFQFKLDIDKIFAQKLKQFLKQKIDQKDDKYLQFTPFVNTIFLLFESINLQVMFQNPRDILTQLGINFNKFDYKKSIQQLKENVNPKELIENMLPNQTTQFIQLLKQHGTAQFEISVNTKLAMVKLQFKLPGIKNIVDLII